MLPQLLLTHRPHFPTPICPCLVPHSPTAFHANQRARELEPRWGWWWRGKHSNTMNPKQNLPAQNKKLFSQWSCWNQTLKHTESTNRPTQIWRLFICTYTCKYGTHLVSNWSDPFFTQETGRAKGRLRIMNQYAGFPNNPSAQWPEHCSQSPWNEVKQYETCKRMLELFLNIQPRSKALKTNITRKNHFHIFKATKNRPKIIRVTPLRCPWSS